MPKRKFNKHPKDGEIYGLKTNASRRRALKDAENAPTITRWVKIDEKTMVDAKGRTDSETIRDYKKKLNSVLKTK